MNNIITTRIEHLRKLMVENGLDAYLINGTDPHISEYVPERWKTRTYISGFTGSFGYMAITANKALLWTDSRYYLQAAQQLEGTGIEMMKARDPESISLEQWLATNLQKNTMVGFNGSCHVAAEIKSLNKTLNSKGIKINGQLNLLESIWNNRPQFPNNKAFLHPIKWAGTSRSEKLKALFNEMDKVSAEVMVISALDDIAWTFNIRGADVESNPVVMAYALLEKNNIQLFTDLSKFDSEAIEELQTDGVILIDYHQFYQELELLKEKSILIDTHCTNYRIYELLNTKNKLIDGLSVPTLLKSVKNSSEISGMQKAHIIDGLALLDLMLWFENSLGKEPISEFDVAEKLSECRAKKFGYIGNSFFPIVAYRDHGAIVHFKVNAETAHQLQPEGILLFDSGGQYEYGTTDITRTIALGPVSSKMKSDFTLVLKGMIALSSIKFPKGIAGCHLDVLARAALWNENLNYGHGTGHGVGAFLNVHEGPQSIRLDFNNQPLCPGNILSNEPGIYRTGEYGIRIENLIHCVEDSTNEFGTFYRFETLTCFPIDTRLIEKSLLNQQEIEWINNYHKIVLTALSPFTSSDEFKLLKRLCEEI